MGVTDGHGNTYYVRSRQVRLGDIVTVDGIKVAVVTAVYESNEVDLFVFESLSRRFHVQCMKDGPGTWYWRPGDSDTEAVMGARGSEF